MSGRRPATPRAQAGSPSKDRGGRTSARSPYPAPPLPARPPISLRHPAWWIALAVAAACTIVSVSYVLFEKDMWQHFAVGRWIWETRSIPTTQLWSWPTYGAPDVNSSWGFRVLVWPIWNAFGVQGVFAWRWLTTLIAFGLLWATARRMGARGFTPLLVIVACGLTYRQRSQIRPETLVAVLLALQTWVLETRRSGGPDRSLWLIPIAWAWANTHISWHLGFVQLGIHLIDGWLATARGRAAPHLDPRRLTWIALAALAISFVTPFGWRALWQPFDFVLHQRHEEIFRSIPELMPLALSRNLTNGLPLVLGGWLLLILGRLARRRFDMVEALLFAVFVGLSFMTQRFLGFTMLIAVPYLARDLDEWVSARTWPAWTAPAWSRAALVAAACVLAGVIEWRRADLPLGVAIDMRQVPVAAADAVERLGLRGRAFNQFYLGGYMVHRFRAERSRLPFMDIHQAGTFEDRYAYAFALRDPRAWSDLVARHRFDYALLRRVPYSGDRLIDFLDADTSYVLVFMDDAAALYVRRDGTTQALANSAAYRVNPAGPGRLGVLGAALLADSSLRARSVEELEREVRESPFHAQAEVRLGNLALATGDRATATTHLRRAIANHGRVPRAHERLGVIALQEGRPRDALREFAAERRLIGSTPGTELGTAKAWQALGDREGARRHYRAALVRDAGNAEALDSLAALERSILPR